MMTREKVARCSSPYFERVWRLSGFVACLFFVPSMLLKPAPIDLREVFVAIISALMVGAITVRYCYALDPAGPGKYFSISSRFQNGQ